MNWPSVEQIIGFKVPECLKLFLSSSGYDNVSSLGYISENSLILIENHMSENLHLIQSIDCCYAESYKKQDRKFKLLPGHWDLLLAVSKQISTHLDTRNREIRNTNYNIVEKAVQNHPNYSTILKELIKTVLQNVNTPINRREYSDIIKYFATYVFIIGGRSLYEVLRKNFLLPSASTVCTY